MSGVSKSHMIRSCPIRFQIHDDCILETPCTACKTPCQKILFAWAWSLIIQYDSNRKRCQIEKSLILGRPTSRPCGH